MQTIVIHKRISVNPDMYGLLDHNQHMDSRQVIARNLRNLKTKYEMKNDAIAKKAGVGTGTVSRIESCAVSPTTDTLDAIAAVFGLHAWQLMIVDLDIDSPQRTTKMSDEDESRLRQLDVSLKAIGR